MTEPIVYVLHNCDNWGATNGIEGIFSHFLHDLFSAVRELVEDERNDICLDENYGKSLDDYFESSDVSGLSNALMYLSIVPYTLDEFELI